MNFVKRLVRRFVKKINLLEKKLNIKEKKETLKKLQEESSQPDFWKDPQLASKKMVELAELQKEIKEIETLRDYHRSGEKEKFEKALKKLEMKTFLSGKYDRSAAILSVHAGQGGTEAQDWAEMLKRMYIRFIEKQGWKWKSVEETRGEEAGIKSSTIMISGAYAYGFLKHEAGTHRLVRLSPFNADHLRQTSFALVEVLPIIKEAEVELKGEEIEFDAFRSSGPGGQFVQKVATAVRLRHKPTGIVVESQAERSQIQNRKICEQILKSKLWEREQEKRKKEIKKIKGEYKAASWGNQIRSYVLHPYHQVKDLRTGCETTDTEAILDGDLENFIEAAIYQLS
jgi:peptide chain release factor 2